MSYQDKTGLSETMVRVASRIHFRDGLEKSMDNPDGLGRVVDAILAAELERAELACLIHAYAHAFDESIIDMGKVNAAVTAWQISLDGWLGTLSDRAILESKSMSRLIEGADFRSADRSINALSLDELEVFKDIVDREVASLDANWENEKFALTDR